MGMGRAEVTAGLSELLKRDKLSRYWASEVTINWGRENECRVDFMDYSPRNQTIGGVEHGRFTCYEIKSCPDDFKSKNGHNFLGDDNYYVMTMATWKALMDANQAAGKVINQLPRFVGLYVAVPKSVGKSNKAISDEFMNPTKFTGESLQDWRLHKNTPSFVRDRVHSMSYLLFMMLRSGR